MLEQLLRIEEEGKIHLTNKVTVCKEEKLLYKRMNVCEKCYYYYCLKRNWFTI